MDQRHISELLRRLTARQEKVIRLRFGLGCQRPHSVPEMAEEFGVAPSVIAGILETAGRKLSRQGLNSEQLREAARNHRGFHGRSDHASRAAPVWVPRAGLWRGSAALSRTAPTV